MFFEFIFFNFLKLFFFGEGGCMFGKLERINLRNIFEDLLVESLISGEEV